MYMCSRREGKKGEEKDGRKMDWQKRFEDGVFRVIWHSISFLMP